MGKVPVKAHLRFSPVSEEREPWCSRTNEYNKCHPGSSQRLGGKPASLNSSRAELYSAKPCLAPCLHSPSLAVALWFTKFGSMRKAGNPNW